MKVTMLHVFSELAQVSQADTEITTKKNYFPNHQHKLEQSDFRGCVQENKWIHSLRLWIHRKYEINSSTSLLLWVEFPPKACNPKAKSSFHLLLVLQLVKTGLKRVTVLTS